MKGKNISSFAWIEDIQQRAPSWEQLKEECTGIGHNPWVLLAGSAVALKLGVFAAQKWRNRIKRNTVLELDLSHIRILEHEPDSLLQLFGDNAVSLRVLLEALFMARRDPNVVALMFKVGDISQIPLGIIQELRNAVQAFVKEKKPAVCYAESFGELCGSNSTYYLATGFSHIFMAPCGHLNVRTTLVSHPFLRSFLDKWQIQPQFYGKKEFKSAANLFMQKKFTQPHRENLEQLVKSVEEIMTEDIMDTERFAGDRAKVQKMFEEGPFTSKQAKDKGFVNELLYRDQLRDKLHEICGLKRASDLSWLFVTRYHSKKGTPFKGKTKVAYIPCVGQIHQGEQQEEWGSDKSSIGSDTTCALLRAAIKDKSVKAIILRVASPGGSAIASDAITREVMRAREHGKKVVVSMGHVAASGGYYIACQADKILAPRLCITGSIGVVFGKFVLKEFLEYVGVTHDHVSTGENSSLDSSLFSFTAKQEKVVDDIMEDIYVEFKNLVSEGRCLGQEEVEAVAKGRVWTGAEAKQLKLIDAHGSYLEAIKVAADLIGVKFKDIKVDVYPKSKSILSELRTVDNEDQRDSHKAGASLLNPFNMMQSIGNVFHIARVLSSVITQSGVPLQQLRFDRMNQSSVHFGNGPLLMSMHSSIGM